MIVVETFRDQAQRFASQPGKHEEADDATRYEVEWTAFATKASNLAQLHDSTGESNGSSVESMN